MVQVAERNNQYFGKEDHNTVVTITDGGVLASNTGSLAINLINCALCDLVRFYAVHFNLDGVQK